MVNIDDLYTVYFLARKNKRRSEDAVVFEVDYERRIRNLHEAINECTYRADSNYTFIGMRPKPREVFACELEARIIQWYIIWRILPILENTLSDSTFNNRKGMGTDAAVKKVAEDIKRVTCNYTREAWVIQWDLAGCFPNANCDIACKQLQQLVIDNYTGEDKENLLWMIMISIHAYPQNHCYRKSPREMWGLIDRGKSLFEKPEGTGGAIGFLIWQVAMNLYFNDIDHWSVDDMGQDYTRFVDDSVMVVENKSGGLLLMPLFREKYAELGATMHPRKFYCQPASHGVHFIGNYIKNSRIYVHNRTIRQDYKTIRNLNAFHNKVKGLETFISSVNSIVGNLKHKNEYKNICKLVSEVSTEWRQYVGFDDSRICFVAKKGYKHHDIIKYKFNKIKAL
jgi:hypothetical protein